MSLSWQFSCKTTAFYSDQYTTPLLFEVSQNSWNHPLKNYCFIWDAISHFIRHKNCHMTTDFWAGWVLLSTANGFTSILWTVDCLALYYNDCNRYEIFSALPHCGTVSTAGLMTDKMACWQFVFLHNTCVINVCKEFSIKVLLKNRRETLSVHGV